MEAAQAIREGFPGQRMTVLPRPRVRAALDAPCTSALIVTDAGYFPHAVHHGRERTQAISQAIVILCARGRGWVQSGSTRTPVEHGQFVVIPPGITHAYGADDQDPWTLWWMHVDGSLVGDWCRLSGFATTPAVRRLLDPQDAIGLMQQIVSRSEVDPAPANILAAAGAAWHLMTLLGLRQIRDVSTSSSIERVAAYVRRQYADQLSVGSLAVMAGLSTSHFAALFREHVGQPVHAYQTDLRMARARELLDITDLPIAEIATGVGYADSFYFTRQFKRLHGVSPTAYRRQKKG